MPVEKRMDVDKAVMIAETLDDGHSREDVEAAEHSLNVYILTAEKCGDYVPQHFFWAHDGLERALAPMKRTFAHYGGSHD